MKNGDRGHRERKKPKKTDGSKKVPRYLQGSGTPSINAIRARDRARRAAMKDGARYV